MFELFFLEWNNKIFKEKVDITEYRKLSVKKWLLLIVMLIFPLMPLVIYAFTKLYIWFLLIFVFFFIEYIICITYIKYRKIKLNDCYVEKYKIERINGLVKILRSNQFNLYNTNGIDWLITCCNNQNSKKITDKIKNIFSKIYPFLTILFGYFLDKLDVETFAYIFTFIIVFISLLLFIYIIIVPVINFVIFNSKNPYESLIEDLEYIKTQLHKNKKVNKQ